jgi:hypothetical protein
MANSNVLQMIFTYDAEGNLSSSYYVVGDPAALTPEAVPTPAAHDCASLSDGRDYGDFGRLADAEGQCYSARFAKRPNRMKTTGKATHWPSSTGSGISKKNEISRLTSVTKRKTQSRAARFLSGKPESQATTIAANATGA